MPYVLRVFKAFHRVHDGCVWILMMNDRSDGTGWDGTDCLSMRLKSGSKIMIGWRQIEGKRYRRECKCCSSM